MHTEQATHIIVKMFKRSYFEYDSLVDEININHRAIHNKMVNYDDENKMCYTDINMFMVGLNLAYTDRAS